MAAEQRVEVVVTSTDARVGELLSKGSPEAIEVLYDMYGRLAYSIAFRVLNDAAAAEDAVQDAFLSVWRRGSTYEADRGGLRNWVCGIVRNRAIDKLRGRSGHARRDLPLESTPLQTSVSETWDAVALELDRDHVRTALDGLPAEQRQTVELAYFGGYTQTEISDLMRVPLGTVKGRTRAALLKLRGLLEARGVGWTTS